MNTCPTAEEIIQSLHGQLADSYSAEIETHVDGCDSCCQSVESHIAKCPTCLKMSQSAVESTTRAHELRKTHKTTDSKSEIPHEFVDRLKRNPPSVAGLFPATASYKAPHGAKWNLARDALSGTRLADYVLEEEIGRGGMGVVYRAKQDRPNRYVAVKLIRPDKVSADYVSRFRFEADVAGNLRHPNIVSVYATGTENDLEYLSMPLVADANSLRQLLTNDDDGLSKTKQDAWEPKDAAQLLMTIAEAMEYVHQNGIIHRDLKPGNILIDKDMKQAHVTDFGLAKRAENGEIQSHAETLRATDPLESGKPGRSEVGDVLGTPPYMSPEQAAGHIDKIGFRSDLFSLGVILYELLTGKMPFGRVDKLRTKSPIAPRTVNPEIPRDLEAICLKCLEKDSERRYKSAEALAVDLKRFLDGRETEARTLGPIGKTWYWACRSKALAAACTLGLVVLLLFAVVGPLVAGHEATLRVQAVKNLELARKNEVEADNNFQLAREAINEHLTLIGGDPRMKRYGLEPLRRDLLHAARRFFERLVEKKPNDAMVRTLQTEALGRLANIESELGNLDAGERFYRLALDSFSRLKANTTDPNIACDHSKCIKNLAVIALQSGRVREAESGCREALAIRERLVQQYPQNPEYSMLLADNYNVLGAVLEMSGRLAEAEASYLKAITLGKRLLHDYGRTADFVRDLAMAQQNLAKLYQDTERYDEAEVVLDGALITLNRLVHDHPNVPEFRDLLGAVQNKLGNTFATMKRVDKAEAAYLAALNIRQELADVHPDVPAFRASLAFTMANLANFYATTDRALQAEKAFQAATQAMQSLLDDYPQLPKYQERLAEIYDSLASFYGKDERSAEADKVRQAALKVRGALVAGTSKKSKTSHARLNSDLGDSCLAAGRLAEAEDAYLSALSDCRKLVQEFPEVREYQRQLGQANFNLGDVYAIQFLDDKAIERYRQALGVYQRLANEYPKVSSYRSAQVAILNNIGNRQGEFDSRLAAFEEALQIQQRMVEDYPRIPRHAELLATLHNNLGAMYAQQRHNQLAKAAFEEARRIFNHLIENHHERSEFQNGLGNAYHNLGLLYQTTNDDLETESAYRQAIEVRQRLVKEHPRSRQYRKELAASQTNVGVFEMRRGNLGEAEMHFRGAIEIQHNLRIEHPQFVEYAVALSKGYGNMADLCNKKSGAAGALPWYEKSIASVYAAYQDGSKPSHPELKPVMIDSLVGRASALDDLNQHSQAAEDWYRSFRLTDSNRQFFYLCRHALSLARARNYQPAADAAKALTDAVNNDGVSLLAAVRVYAIAMAAAGDDDALSKQERSHFTNEYAAAAWSALQRLKRIGTLDVPEHVETLREDGDFEPLRARERFNDLITSLKTASGRS